MDRRGRIGAIGIAYAGSWHEVVVDATTRRITERHGFLKHRVDWLGQELGFVDITAVMVEQKTSRESEPAGISSSRATRTVYRKSHTLSLLRTATIVSLPDRQIAVPNYALDLPMNEGKDPLPLEAVARQLARLGGWPARRRGYALMAEGTPGEQRNAFTTKTVPHDWESQITAD